MMWLLSRLVVWPTKAAAGSVKLGAKATAGSAKLGYRTGRFVGYRRMALVAIGVGVGVAIAPGPGREVREKVKRRLAERGYINAGAAAPLESPSPLPDVAAATVAISPNGPSPSPEPLAAGEPEAAAEDPIDLLPDEAGTSGPP